jgi:N-hydroxyarylamine O-acetyltransferase
MAEVPLEQQAWLNRIGYSGSLKPTLETLNRLIFAHAHSISYETLDIVLGRTPKLDIPTLQRKMITGKRGGYCFEQNMLFRAGLRSLGYQITSLQGRVIRGLAIDAQRPAIHMLLQVELPEGRYLADVGFGNLAPTCALRLEPHIEQDTPHEVMRFIDIGGELTLQAKLKYNARVTIRDASGHADKRWLQNRAEYQNVLRAEFGLNISDAEIDECIAVMKTKGSGDAPHPFFA